MPDRDREPPTLYTKTAIASLMSEKLQRSVASPKKPGTRRKLIDGASKRAARRELQGLPEPPEAA